MIIFYEQVRKTPPIVSLKPKVCDAICSSSCVKTKSKCCNKYKKKGINCKRCPIAMKLKAVS